MTEFKDKRHADPDHKKYVAGLKEDGKQKRRDQLERIGYEGRNAMANLVNDLALLPEARANEIKRLIAQYVEPFKKTAV